MRHNLFLVVMMIGCSSGKRTQTPTNTAEPAPEATGTLPCFTEPLEPAEWHRRVRGDRDLAFDVVSSDQPPPGWPDGWQAGTCRVVPKYNEATTIMDFLVQESGRTVATIGPQHIDFYVRTLLPGAQPGDRVGDLPLRDCVDEYNVWQFEGNRLCSDETAYRYLVRTASERPQPADLVIALRLYVGESQKLVD